MGMASIVAQLVGGTLVGLDLFGLSWRLIFIVNVPIGIAATIVGARLIRDSRSEERPSLDWAGVALASTCLFLVVFPLVQGRELGWPSWSIACLIGSVPGFALLVWVDAASRREDVHLCLPFTFCDFRDLLRARPVGDFLWRPDGVLCSAYPVLSVRPRLVTT
jgi:MFS family permease